MDTILIYQSDKETVVLNILNLVTVAENLIQQQKSKTTYFTKVRFSFLTIHLRSMDLFDTVKSVN